MCLLYLFVSIFPFNSRYCPFFLPTFLFLFPQFSYLPWISFFLVIFPSVSRYQSFFLPPLPSFSHSLMIFFVSNLLSFFNPFQPLLSETKKRRNRIGTSKNLVLLIISTRFPRRVRLCVCGSVQCTSIILLPKPLLLKEKP